MLGREGRDLCGDGLHAVRPVEAGASEELDARAFFAGLDAVAVELELVQPAFAGGWGFGLRGELRRDEVGKIFFWGCVEGWSERI